MTRGVYRTFNLESGARSAHVEYDSLAKMDIPEERYRSRGYQPDFNTLPWKDNATPTVFMNASDEALPPQLLQY